MHNTQRRFGSAGPRQNRSQSISLFLFFLCVSLFVLVSFAQHQARADSAGLVRMADIESGALLLNSTEPGKYVPAPLLATDVQIDVTGPLARARVTQHFINPGDGWVAGKYVFPLPENSAVDTLKMVIGTRVIEGQIKEKQEARQIYEDARADGRRASLVEQQRPNVFTNSVANIGPRETIVVQIEYQQTVRQDGDAFSLRFPMVVAPRYVPMSATPQLVDFKPGEGGWGEILPPEAPLDLEQPPVLHPDMGKINPVSLAISLDAGFALGTVESAHHEISLTRDGARKAKLTLAEELTPANKDFELVWKPAAASAPAAALFRERVGDEDYILVMLTPPAGHTLPNAKPREIILVIDNSGSMSGPSMVQAKQSLLWALDRLTPGDTFNVIRFDHTMTVLFPQAVAAHGENLDVARRYVRGLSAQGGTEMLPALKASLIDPNANDNSRLRQCFPDRRRDLQRTRDSSPRSPAISAGRASSGGHRFGPQQLLHGPRGRSRARHLHAYRQGNAGCRTHERALRQASEPRDDRHRGTLARRAQYAKLASPVPDLSGRTHRVVGPYAESGGTLTLRGQLAGAPWEIRLPIDAGETRPGIGKLWARRKIEQLEADARIEGDWQKHDGDILKTALGHHLVSRLTSLVAVDVTPARPDGAPLTSRDMPVNLPDGWDYEKVFGGEAMPAAQRAAFKTNAAPMLAMAAMPASADASGAGLALPQTSTDADAMIHGGLLAFMLAALLVALRWLHRQWTLGAYARRRL